MHGIHNRVTTLEEAYQLAANYEVKSQKAKGVRPFFRTSGSGRGRDNNNRTGRGTGRTKNDIKQNVHVRSVEEQIIGQRILRKKIHKKRLSTRKCILRREIQYLWRLHMIRLTLMTSY